jgi:hypothetical protein
MKRLFSYALVEDRPGTSIEKIVSPEDERVLHQARLIVSQAYGEAASAGLVPEFVSDLRVLADRIESDMNSPVLIDKEEI